MDTPAILDVRPMRAALLDELCLGTWHSACQADAAGSGRQGACAGRSAGPGTSTSADTGGDGPGCALSAANRLIPRESTMPDDDIDDDADDDDEGDEDDEDEDGEAEERWEVH